ncbi:MAG: hypothetical protein QXH30_02630 [Candidatus Bilamarchaeaceae archaeon]
MGIMVCERCGKQTAKLEACSYCKKMCCISCEKSSKKPDRLTKLIICKSCWGNMEKRRKFKRA